MRQRISGFLRHSGTRRPAAEHVRQFAERGDQIEHSQPGHGAAHEVVGEEGFQKRDQLDEVIPVPERGPGNQDEQQPRLEQECDE